MNVIRLFLVVLLLTLNLNSTAEQSHSSARDVAIVKATLMSYNVATATVEAQSVISYVHATQLNCSVALRSSGLAVHNGSMNHHYANGVRLQSLQRAISFCMRVAHD